MRRVQDALDVHVSAKEGTTASGIDRITLDESHRVALLHPQYDGFIVIHAAAQTDIADLRFVIDEELANVITPQHAIGPLFRGQVRPIDLELHPGAIPLDQAITGLIHIVDDRGVACSPAMRLTLAVDATLDCVLAGSIDGPWVNSSEFERAAKELVDGVGDAKAFARRISALERGRPDPGWRKQRSFFRRGRN